jgi:hypothetical protein
MKERSTETALRRQVSIATQRKRISEGVPLLEHEEHDMMRPLVVLYLRIDAQSPSASANRFGPAYGDCSPLPSRRVLLNGAGLRIPMTWRRIQRLSGVLEFRAEAFSRGCREFGGSAPRYPIAEIAGRCARATPGHPAAQAPR